MPNVADIKMLNIDGIQHSVDDMSEEVKKMVEVFNDWNREEAQLRQDLAKIQSAKNDLSRKIILQVRNDLEPKNETDNDAEIASTV